MLAVFYKERGGHPSGAVVSAPGHWRAPHGNGNSNSLNSCVLFLFAQYVSIKSGASRRVLETPRCVLIKAGAC